MAEWFYLDRRALNSAEINFLRRLGESLEGNRHANENQRNQNQSGAAGHPAAKRGRTGPKHCREADTKITKRATLKISRLPPGQQAEAAAILTTVPPAKKKPDTADLESLLKDFKAHAQRFISGMTAFDQQADTFARMSYV